MWSVVSRKFSRRYFLKNGFTVVGVGLFSAPGLVACGQPNAASDVSDPVTNWSVDGNNRQQHKIRPIACWGDSLTEGNEDQSGVTYPNVLASVLNRTVYNGGIGGQKSAQIKARMLADTAKHSWMTIIWAGANNSGLPDDDIAAMVAALESGTPFLVLSLLNGNADSHSWRGGDVYNAIFRMNSSMASTYPDNYFDVRAFLISQYDPNQQQDVRDHEHDSPPTSLMYRGSIHPTGQGYKLIGQRIASIISANKW